MLEINNKIRVIYLFKIFKIFLIITKYFSLFQIKELPNDEKFSDEYFVSILDLVLSYF